MITAKNISTAKIDFAKLPAKFKEDFADIKEMAAYADQDADIKEAVDAYVASLNAELGKAKPKAAPKKKAASKPNFLTYPEVTKLGHVSRISGDPYDYVSVSDKRKFYATTKDIDKTPSRELKNSEYPVKSVAKLFLMVDNEPGKLKELSVKEWPKYIATPAQVQKVYREENETWEDVKERRKSKPKATAKRKAPAKKSSTKRTQSQSEAAKAKKAYEADKRKAIAGEFANLSQAEVIAIGRKVHANRRLAAQVVDETADHKKRLTPTPENLVRWMKEPGKFDLIGVDNYKKDDPTADLRIKKEIFWARLLKK